MVSRKRLFTRNAVLTVLLALAGVLFFAAGTVLIAIAATPVPSISSFATRQVNQSTKIFDRTGQVLLYDYNRDSRRAIVPLAAVSPNAINAIVAMEDSNFYEHGGVRMTSIIRALLADLFGGSFNQGGSTITQQVVKNTLLTNKKSIIRKVHELILALKLEQAYSKDQILETYLNSIPLGGTLYGVEAASEAYYGIPAKDLSVAQAAYLAAMVPAPSYYSPSGPNRALLDTRKERVLERMRTLGFIDDTTFAVAKEEKVSFSRIGKTTINAPHFVFYVLNHLEATYGSEALILGLKVVTTLDADLQVKAESLVHETALKNEAGGGANNAALVAIEPSTGQILSMVGSRDFFDTAIDGQYNAALALRQPGSTMKPFIYSLALMRGYTPSTVVFDVPTQFSTSCSPADIFNNRPPCYAPRNYDGKFRGAMTFQTALAQSINIPAVKVLYLVGIKNAVELAKSFGLTTLGEPSRYGLTLVLGGGEVRLLDLVSAFGVLGNDGVRQAPAGILEVQDAEGVVLESYAPDPRYVVPSTIARTVSAMLSNAPARVPQYALDGVLTIPGHEVAAKTGTTDNSRDAWTVGYTPAIAIGVWVGNNDNTPAQSLAGLIAAPLWKQTMVYALTKYPQRYFGEPDPLPSDLPPILQGNWAIADANGQTIPHSLLYWTNPDNPQGPPPTNLGTDPQFAYWEYGISSWFASYSGLY